MIPVAITRQNSRSTSLRCEGAPGDFIAERPVNAFIQPAGLPTNTSLIKVLRRPVEFTQYTSIKYSERLAELGAAPSIGSVGDAYDNAMAESMMGAYKTELIKREGLWRNVDHVEFETLTYVDWFNNRRLHGELGYVPPSEFEETYYRDPRAATKAAEVITI